MDTDYILAAIIVGLILTAVLAVIAMKLPDRRERLTAAALTGLLADHKDHSDECADGEECHETVARLAVKHADRVIYKLDHSTEGMT